MKNNKLFLGGTCNNSTWRDKLISMLTCTYFNPVVPDWNKTAYQEELRQRKSCEYCLYVITPNMTDVYSIAEADKYSQVEEQFNETTRQWEAVKYF